MIMPPTGNHCYYFRVFFFHSTGIKFQIYKMISPGDLLYNTVPIVKIIVLYT